MRRLWCAVVGHDPIAVREAGLVARPGGMLPSLDGYMSYEPDPDGEFDACMRCGNIIGAAA